MGDDLNEEKRMMDTAESAEKFLRALGYEPDAQGNWAPPKRIRYFASGLGTWWEAF